MPETNTVENQKNSKKLPVIIAAVVILLLIFTLVLMKVVGGDSNKIKNGLNDGLKFLEELKFDDAIAAYEKVLELDPKNVEAYLGITDAYIGKGDYNKALEYAKTGYAETADQRLADKVVEVNALIEAINGGTDSETNNQSVDNAENSSEDSTNALILQNSQKWHELKKIYGDITEYEYEYDDAGNGRVIFESDSYTQYRYEYNADGSYRKYTSFLDYPYVDGVFDFSGTPSWVEYYYTDYDADGYELYEYGAYSGYELHHDEYNETIFEYDYDDEGRPVLSYRDYNNWGMHPDHQYEYDEKGRITASYVLDENYDVDLYFDTNYYEYIEINGKTYTASHEYYTNSEGDPVKETFLYTYDANGMLIKEEYFETSEYYGESSSETIYTYDQYGNLINESITSSFAGEGFSYSVDYKYSFDVFPEGKSGDTIIRTVTMITSYGDGDSSEESYDIEYIYVEE